MITTISEKLIQNEKLTNRFNQIKSLIDDIIPSSFNRTYVKLVLFCLLISAIYLFITRTIAITRPIKTFTVQIKQNQTRTKVNAFVITADCNSIRYRAAKENIEGAFPDFFNIICFVNIPLTDPRIHTSKDIILKRFSSNLLAFIEIWTYRIPEYSKHNPYEWTFVFEDDVNFMNATKISLPNFIAPLQDMMNNPEIQMTDGFIYLGICGPEYRNNSQLLISKNTSDVLISRKGYGFCLHATGITAKRSRLFWTEISSYRPNPQDSSLDLQLRQYSMRSKNHFYIFGTNYHWPPGTGHYGIAFQDRGRFYSTVTED